MTARAKAGVRENEPVIAALLLIATAMMFGGGARSDIAVHTLVRTVAIAVLAWSLIRGVHPGLRGLQTPIWLAGLWTAMIAAQLIPLPPSVWAALPQRAEFLTVFKAVGVGNVWRPLTMSPNATENALFASVVPLSVLVAMSRLHRRDMPVVIGGVLVIGAVSAFLGIVQITSQSQWAYFYRITNQGAAVGLFANRNHQALLMAEIFPLLALIAAWPNLQTRQRNLNEFAAISGAVLLVPLILITGSRAGLVLMLIGVVGSAAIYRSAGLAFGRMGSHSTIVRSRGRRSRWIPLSLTAGLIGLVGLTVVLSRAEAVSRLFSEDVSQEIRVKLFRAMLAIGNDFAPWGAGFGTFDPVFRMHEPFSNLSALYVNHAHDDLLEIYIEGGAVALALLLAFLAWMGSRSARAWQALEGKPSAEQLMTRCGSVILVMALAASLADYPLRTPAHETIAAVAVAMLAAGLPRKKFFDRLRR